MKKINVLEIIGDSTLSGGSISLLTLIKGLNKRQFNITCICPPGPLAGMLNELKDVVVEVVPMRSKWDIEAIKKIRKIISKLKTKTSDLIVHSHGVRGGWLGRLACLGPKKNAPKIVYTEHLWTDEYKLNNPLAHIFQIFGLWLLDFLTTKTIAVSNAVADFLVKKGITRPEKIKVIYNGIEQRVKSKKGREKRRGITIGFVGGLTKNKGVEYLIRAVAEIILKHKSKISNLVIIGEGEEKKKLKNLTKKLKIDKLVEFKGLVEDPSIFYPTLDIYVQPSLSESFGIAALEAMSFGVPVIASNAGGLRELLALESDNIKDKDLKKPYLLTDCGILVPPKNVAALSAAIAKLIKDKKLRSRLGSGAKRRAKQYPVEKMVEKTEKLYFSLIE
uniref:Glycosyltransferase family 1 protein n=1 Tax=candidate division CPR3 bacterium TaxID=2268181 RepID=A0A7V3JA34_UNCC3